MPSHRHPAEASTTTEGTFPDAMEWGNSAADSHSANHAPEPEWQRIPQEYLGPPHRHWGTWTSTRSRECPTTECPTTSTRVPHLSTDGVWSELHGSEWHPRKEPPRPTERSRSRNAAHRNPEWDDWAGVRSVDDPACQSSSPSTASRLQCFPPDPLQLPIAHPREELHGSCDSRARHEPVSRPCHPQTAGEPQRLSEFLWKTPRDAAELPTTD